ncbi:TetR family transcriptional regulator [Nocardiopsis exhalans]|uniref:TetR family transcriptional regulator n=1 Tax=Nocardiopsis exhalans TaxID=163604 RepID=A0ABY5DC06_9ACTN|nr:TetR family transcriptional regulator [Nocardiopsis exhalans]USY21872.1 TetR family transcriptional regulator [Nocardiopsis exhalans]
MSGTAERVDGRRARGERRREEIIAATLRVVERDGVAGVTHRAVAREADVPASSAVYYFKTMDDLLVAALTAASDTYIDQLAGLRSSPGEAVAGLARVIASARGEGRARALAERELNLLAARRPALRPVARRWRDAVSEVARGQGADDLTVRQFAATADGLCARILLGDEDLTEARITETLQHALRGD